LIRIYCPALNSRPGDLLNLKLLISDVRFMITVTNKIISLDNKGCDFTVSPITVYEVLFGSWFYNSREIPQVGQFFNSVKKHRKDSNFTRLRWRIYKTQEELLLIANELLSKNKDSNAGKFIIKTGGKVTLFA